jgi:hypothetical protein
MAELPKRVQDVTAAFVEAVDRRLPGQPIGLVLHGSICWGDADRDQRGLDMRDLLTWIIDDAAHGDRPTA